MKQKLILFAIVISMVGEVFAQQFSSVSQLRQAAEGGNAVAQNTLAIELITGQNMTQDIKKAVYWFEKAAEQGHQDAQVNAGRAYAEGYLGQPDFEKALGWFKKAVDQGKNGYANTYATALYYIGICYEQMNDNVNAVVWLKKAVAENEPSSKCALGKHYIFGLGISKDETRGFNLIKEGAEMGDPDAQNMMGYCYQFGIGAGKDDSQSFQWYQKSADNGVPTAIMNLGACYSEGRGVKVDYDKALSLYRQAADYGEFNAYVEIGRCYINGEGVAKDIEQASDYFDTAAKNGLPKGILWSGILNYEKEYGLQNYAKAAEMFRKYAEQYSHDNVYEYDDYSLGYVYRRLSSIYRYGRGVAPDEYIADEYMKKSRDLGDEISDETLKNYMKIK